VGQFDLDDMFGDHENPPEEPGRPMPVSLPDRPAAQSDDSPQSRRGGQPRQGQPPAPLATRDEDAAFGEAIDAFGDGYQPDEDGAVRYSHGDFNRLVQERGIATAEQIASAERVARQTPGKTVAQSLIEMGVNEIAVQEVVALVHHLPFERVDCEASEPCDMKLFKRLGQEYCKSNLVLPLRREGNRVVVGTSNPDDVFLLDDVKRRLKVGSVKHVLIAGYDVRGVIELFDEGESAEYNVDEILADVDEDDVELLKEDKQDVDVEDADSSPVVRYVNHIIQTAIKEGASDIHVEPHEKTLTVRFRIDGVLFEMMNPPRKMHAALTSRIKIMGNMDIAERRLPQDGRVRVNVLGRKLDLRVSTIPTPYGEKTVMRILDTRSINVTLEQLGFSEDTLTIWKNQIAQPHGIILVTGPTGSGKTTTLYSSLKQMDRRKLNISTVEDPVEYNLDGITQIQTHERIGMTFAKALKALLRQDPDVIMVGEIRDMDTATTAIQAALTGHLVLSTLHTNDAPASITRLINIGIEPFLVGAAVNAVLAQRLVRRICDGCKKPQSINPDIAEYLEVHGITKQELYYGQGCSKCRETGYIGRCGLYELLVLDDHTRDSVARNPNVTEFRRTCSERGMVSLREDGFKKVEQGLTTVEEILRVTEATI
jgi:type IV pilus assembly protein PilB